MNCDAASPACAIGGVASVLCVAIVLLTGCGGNTDRPAPPIYPVKGTLVLESGASPEHATIEFTPKDGSKALSAMGIADAEGMFTLRVPYPDRQLPGAAEGVYRVVVMLPLKPDRTGGQRYELKQQFVVEPRENNFEIKVSESSQ